MQFLSFLFLLTFYPILRITFVPRAYRVRYDQYPKQRLKVGAALLYWLTVLIPLMMGEMPEIGGLGLHAVGAVLIVAAMRVNPFFVPDTVWLPGQYMVQQGVYRWLAHPGYTGMVLMTLGNVLALGTFAAIPSIFYLSLLFFHVRREREVLQHAR